MMSGCVVIPFVHLAERFLQREIIVAFVNVFLWIRTHQHTLYSVIIVTGKLHGNQLTRKMCAP